MFNKREHTRDLELRESLFGVFLLELVHGHDKKVDLFLKQTEFLDFG